jgi:hypothetical protein
VIWIVRSILALSAAFVLLLTVAATQPDLRPSTDPGALTPETLVAYSELMLRMSDLGHPIFLVETHRNCARQDWLFERGRTRARCGESLHQTGKAFDVGFVGANPYAKTHPWNLLVREGERLGLVSGSHWGEATHFEWRGGDERDDADVQVPMREMRSGLRGGTQDVAEAAYGLWCAGAGAA